MARLSTPSTSGRPPLAAAPIAAAVALAVTMAMQPTGVHCAEAGAALLEAYPEQLDRIDGGTLVWRDGTRMRLDDGKGEKSFEAWLSAPDIKDMLRLPYVAGSPSASPTRNDDPGRARNNAFFDHMYGDCQKGGVTKNLAEIVWLPRKFGQRLKVTRINGVDRKLQAVSAELDALPASFDSYLIPAAGTYNCRDIAGTNRKSAHGYGIAIDIAVKRSDYWRWSAGGPSGPVVYKNRIPFEIVRIFEKHGFIWGGKWYHYDTMHFEYRPELLPPAK